MAMQRILLAVILSCGQSDEFEAASVHAQKVVVDARRPESFGDACAAYSEIISRFPNDPRADRFRLSLAAVLTAERTDEGADEAVAILKEIIDRAGVSNAFGRKAVQPYIESQVYRSCSQPNLSHALSVSEAFLASQQPDFLFRVQELEIGSLRSLILMRLGREAEAVESQRSLLRKHRKLLAEEIQNSSFDNRAEDYTQLCDAAVGAESMLAELLRNTKSTGILKAFLDDNELKFVGDALANARIDAQRAIIRPGQHSVVFWVIVGILNLLVGGGVWFLAARR